METKEREQSGGWRPSDFENFDRLLEDERWMDAGIWVRRGRRNPQGWGGETGSVCSAPEVGKMTIMTVLASHLSPQSEMK